MKQKISIILVLLLLLVFGCGNSATAFATEGNITYTDVLQDLQKDVTFDTSKYPADTTNNGLSVVTLAESVNNELFVYVYSPAGHEATSVNIATDKDNLRFTNYQLQLVDKSSVFGKYKVYGFTVASDAERYYELSGIYRAFIDGVDEPPAGGNTVSEVSYAVNTGYTFTGTGDDVNVTTTTVETITVTDKYVGFVRYPDGGIFTTKTGCDVHHVAFSTDKTIDKLLEVDVYYKYQTYHYEDHNIGVEKQSFGTSDVEYMHVNASEEFSYSGSGWFSYNYNWKSIEKSSDFIKNLNGQTIYNAMGINSTVSVPLTDPSLITSKDWVFRFAITDYNKHEYPSYDYNGYTTEDGTIISDVTILRLSFETKGVPYNLGCVDNKQTGAVDPDTGLPLPDNPGGVDVDTTFDPKDAVETFADKLKTIAMWVVGALIVIVAWKVIRWIVDFIRGK